MHRKFKTKLAVLCLKKYKKEGFALKNTGMNEAKQNLCGKKKKKNVKKLMWLKFNVEKKYCKKTIQFLSFSAKQEAIEG